MVLEEERRRVESKLPRVAESRLLRGVVDDWRPVMGSAKEGVWKGEEVGVARTPKGAAAAQCG